VSLRAKRKFECARLRWIESWNSFGRSSAGRRSKGKDRYLEYIARGNDCLWKTEDTWKPFLCSNMSCKIVRRSGGPVAARRRAGESQALSRSHCCVAQVLRVAVRTRCRLSMNWAWHCMRRAPGRSPVPILNFVAKKRPKFPDAQYSLASVYARVNACGSV